MKTPIKLIFEGNQVATISNFGYETPWASGKVDFINEELFEKLVKVTLMLSFEFEIEDLGLSKEEEEKMWEAKLAELKICWEDLDLDQDEKWLMEPSGGEKQNIYALRFYKNGFMEWRL